MSGSLGEAILELSADMGELRRNLGEARRETLSAIQGLSSFAKSTLSSALGFFIADVVRQGIGAMVNLGREALSAYAGHELLSQSLQTLVAREMRNADEALTMSQALAQAGGKAQELLGWIQKLAIKSPFTQEGVATAFRTAMAYGFASDEAKRLTEAMINFAAGSGQTEEVMNQIALALGQIKARGTLAGQEVLQLVNAGIDVRGILAKAFGKTTEEIMAMQEKGLIPADKAIEAIVESLESDFAGAAERTSVTFSGLLSTLADVKSVGLREFFGGIFEAIQPVIASFAEWLQGPGIEKLREWGDVLGGIVRDGIEWLREEGVPTILAFFGWVQENGDLVKGALIGIGVAILASVIPALVAAVTTAAPMVATFAILAAAGALLYRAWTSNWGGIQEKVAAVWAWMQSAFQQVRAWLEVTIPAALQFLSESWNVIWGGIQAVVRAILPSIQGLISAFRAAVAGDWYQFGASLRQVWDNNWKLMGQILQGAGSLIKNALVSLFRNALDFIRSIDWGSVGKQAIEGIIAGFWKMANAVAVALVEIMRAAVQAIMGFLGIQSPSRLFRDEIGENIMKGWMEGIRLNAPKLEAELQATARHLVVAAQPQAAPAGVGATFYGPVTFRVENGKTMRDILRELR